MTFWATMILMTVICVGIFVWQGILPIKRKWAAAATPGKKASLVAIYGGGWGLGLLTGWGLVLAALFFFGKKEEFTGAFGLSLGGSISDKLDEIRGDVSSMRTNLSATRRDVGDLKNRVNALEQGRRITSGATGDGTTTEEPIDLVGHNTLVAITNVVNTEILKLARVFKNELDRLDLATGTQSNTLAQLTVVMQTNSARVEAVGQTLAELLATKTTSASRATNSYSAPTRNHRPNKARTVTVTVVAEYATPMDKHTAEIGLDLVAQQIHEAVGGEFYLTSPTPENQARFRTKAKPVAERWISTTKAFQRGFKVVGATFNNETEVGPSHLVDW